MKATLSEKDLQAAVMDLARRSGWMVAHWHDSRREVRPGVFVGDKDAAGFPDLVLVRNSELLFVELKSQKGKLRPEQHGWLEALTEAGQECHVWRPSDFEDITKRLSRRRRRSA